MPKKGEHIYKRKGQKYIDDFRPTCEFKVQIRLKKFLVSRILCRYGRSK